MQRFSRRFLIAGAAALAARAADNSTVRLERPVRLAIIGFDGHPGEITGQLSRLPDVQVIAIADSTPAVLERAKRNPRLASAVPYRRYEEMLDREKLDLVAVCNNNGERAAAILACAKRKLNIIAEKPLAITRADFEKVRKTVDQAGVRLGMLLPMRFDSHYLAMKKVVDDGLIGEVAQIGAQKSYKTGDRPAWFLKKETYGSTMLWIGIHMVDLMRWTSGREFREAAGFESRVGFPELDEMNNVTASLFRLDNNGVAALRMDYLRTQTAVTHGDDRLRLAGTKGVLEYQAATGLTLMTSEQKPHVLDNLPQKQSVFVDFLESVYNGKTASLPVSDIYRVNEIVIAADEAAAQHKIIEIS
ncbi:MAG: Gfo/Idh/MocA family protein [Bryobacteraceae bacterium]